MLAISDLLQQILLFIVLATVLFCVDYLQKKYIMKQIQD